MKRRTRMASAVVLSLAAAPGCAGKAPWLGLSGKPNLPPPVSVTTQSDGDSMGKLAQLNTSPDSRFAKPSTQFPHPAGVEEKPRFAAVGGAVSSVWQKTKDALTIEPEVVRAPDPLSLSTPTPDIGPELYFASARMHENQGHFEQAEELYRQALAEAPRDLTILVHYARMHDRAGNLDRAAAIYREAIQAHPQEAAAYNDLGLCLARQGQTEGAIAMLHQAASLQPESALYRNNVAMVLVQAGRHEEALAQLTPVHGPAAAHYNVGYLLYKRGQSEAAVHYLQQTLTLDPQMAQAAQLLDLVSGRREMQAVAADEPLQGGFVSPMLHRTPPVSQAYGAAPDVHVSLSSNRQEETGDWGDAPTPATVLSVRHEQGGVFATPLRTPSPSASASASEAPRPHLLPVTR